jgi:hypothetical protein
LKTQEGTRVSRGLERAREASRTPGWSKTLRSTRSSLAPGNRQARGANGARVTATDEVVRPGRRRKPLEREPWTRQRDETGAQGTRRSKPSRACETLRAERSRDGNPGGKWTPRARVVMRDETPREAHRRASARADDCSKDSGGERSSREDAPCVARRRGTVTVEDHHGPSETTRHRSGIWVTRQPRYTATHNTLQGSQLHERLPRTRRRARG